MFPKIVVPQNGWFIRENPIEMDDLGIPLFLETPIYLAVKMYGQYGKKTSPTLDQLNKVTRVWIHSLKLTQPLKMLLFQGSIFGGYISFREGGDEKSCI